MSPFAKYALFVLLGVGFGTLSTTVILNKRIAQQNATIEDLKQDASNLDDQIEELQESLRAEVQIKDTISNILTHKLEEAKANPAAQMLAQSGHVMNEEQCRAWMSMGTAASPGGIATLYNAQAGTIIFEPTTRQIDIHLAIGLLRGLNPATLPTFKVGPAGQMAPHWFIPGKVLPMFSGDSRGAFFYFIENDQLTGPMTPQQVPLQ